MILELAFPASGQSIPTDHAYTLYAALSAAVPAFHDPDAGLRLCPITGEPGDRGRLRLTDRSALRVRLPDHAIRQALPLAGRRLDLDGSPVRLGVPAVRTLVPAATLAARIVTIKHADTPERFEAVARDRLAALGVGGELHLSRHADGPRAGEPRRRVVRVRGKAVVGYAVLATGLTAADSLALQERGLGGRLRLGCGFFFTVRTPEGT